MVRFAAGLFALFSLIFGFSSADDCTLGFSVVAPELAVPGKTTAVLVTLHGPSSLNPLNVTLKLSPDGSNDDKELQRRIVETTQEIKGHGILPLAVPADATGSYVLQTLVNCTGTGNEPPSPSADDDGVDRASDVDNGTHCDLQTTTQIILVGPVRDVIIRPARHAYRPGETISFWVLALDHDLQIASGAIGIVSVKNTAGTKVAYWDQVSLDEGVKEFNLPLSKFAQTGRWLLHVEVGSAEFSAGIEVAPGVGNGLPDISAAEEHYVELRFGREMRRRYKPGLPFSGKVEAMSTEKSVRVRVKVYDNTTSIYSQDIEISNGEGTFIVPAILADSDVIALQAELVSVESKEIESHYVLAREPIRKWNSTSDCYLLIEGVEHTLQPDEEAHVTILSTCPCEQRDLHYVITTDGRVTDWAQRRYDEHPLTEGSLTTSTVSSAAKVTQSSGSVCKLNFSFNVKSVMAPVSQLLVYYVTPHGEPVSDVLSFDVKLLHQQVYVMMEDREWWLPDQAVDLEIVAEPSSLVCLLGGRSAGNNDLRFDPRISEDHSIPTTIIGGGVDFLQAGVSFFQRRCSHRGTTGRSAVSYRQRGNGAGPPSATASRRHRPPESLVGGAPYDQLWLWKCFNYTSEVASSGLTIVGPSEAGRWSLWALTVAPASGGLRFSAPVTMQVFRPLQADFHLPESMRVRESIEVDIKIGNNINSCMDITALLALSEGAQFVSNGLLYVTERLRLGPHGATSLVVRVLVTTPGLKNMTVEVNGYNSPSCEGAEGISNTTLAGAVVRFATVLVHPEGTVKTDTESSYFCANEHMINSPSDNFQYEWINAPRNKEALILEVKSTTAKRVGPIHIALAEARQTSEKMYRITMGDADNTISWIGRGRHNYGVQLSSVQTPGILSLDNWQTFWISWDKRTIMIGHGSVLHNDTFLKWTMDKKIRIQHIGFASAWGSLAEFRVWNFNDESGYSQVLHLDTPRSVVPGSESGQLLIAGGLALPQLRRYADDVGAIPTAEPQSAALTDALAALTVLLQMQHLGAAINESTRKEVLKDLPGHLQTILSYRKLDDSFSEHRLMASHKTTLSILEAMVTVQPHFSVDPELIKNVKRWIQMRQEDDGSFLPLSADLQALDEEEGCRVGSDQKDNTAEIKLLKMIHVHPLPGLIIDYKELYKEKSTYIDAIMNMIRNDCVYTTWKQTATGTGRLSSTNPNLQTIPKQHFIIQKYSGTNEKATISLRSAYISRSGYTFFSIDFQNIEFRIFAYLAQDKLLLSTFESNEDIFTNIAKLWNGDKYNEYSATEQRNRMKKIVYSVLYGDGAGKLSNMLNITYNDSFNIIKSFTDTFSGIKTYKSKLILQCKNQGYLTSFSGRRRYFPDINSCDSEKRSYNERQAVNFVIQQTHCIIPTNKQRHQDHITLLTAETLIILHTAIGIETDADSNTIAAAQRYLEVALSSISSGVRGNGGVETLAAVTLALVLVGSNTAPLAVERLRNASTTEDGEFGWVRLVQRKRDAADWLYETAGEGDNVSGIPGVERTTSRSGGGDNSGGGGTVREPLIATVDEFKASIYALTTFCLLDDLRMAESAARYLYYRSHMLDDDAHMELLYPTVRTFALYDTKARDLHRALTVSLATSGMELTDTIELKPGKEGSTLLHLPSLPTKVFVYATGAGCATVQGKITYSTYAAKDSTNLLNVWAGIVQEILPDRSSVEEIEGRSPMLKIKSCFRWNHPKPSGVLRLELDLFSGFELASTTPTLLDPHANLYTMEHGHRGNQLWFVFANVSSNPCPICVQFLTRSVHIIASIRPGYVRVYPAGRADLSADMFFHTAMDNSSLLSGISEDDLITWFGGVNGNSDGLNGWYNKNECRVKEVRNKTTVVKQLVKVSSTTTERSLKSDKADLIDDSTYTINVDSDSIKNLTEVSNNEVKDNLLIVPTALSVPIVLNQSVPAEHLKFNVSDEIILQANTPQEHRKNNLPDSSKNTLSTTAKIIYHVLKLHNNTNIRTETKKNFTQSTELPKSQNNPTTKKPHTKSISNKTAFSIINPITTRAYNDDIISQPKHVNTNKDVEEKVDIRYLPAVKISGDESARTFAPEMKNDKYILLDKEELWGMLKEVVDTQIKSSATKANNTDKERLRRQGLT